MNKNCWDVLPEKFLTTIKQTIPEEKLVSSLESFCAPKPTTFRTNTLKITTEKLKIELQKRNIPYKETGWYSDGFVLDGVPQKVLSESDLYSQGLVYIQSLSSMIPPLVLKPLENEIICDLTAAPGSKTTQMAMLMKNSGTIVANDMSRVRLYKLEANLKTLGVTNTIVSHLKGQTLWQKYPEYFDKTLVDVPCSLEGRFYTGYPKSYASWSPKKVQILSQYQKILLRSGISCTNVGGVIIYSTCTLEPEENEEVIDWVLKREKGSVIVESIHLPLEETMPGITQWKQKVYDDSIKNTIRILPSKQMEGFYIAKLRKIKSTISKKIVL